tara:strand:+ start:141 stop:488 length:348 start_codon:yes stop_codon:yes gene_type:complete
MNKKQRIYFDTSFFGGYFDNEFKEFTKPLFERITGGEFIVLLSAVLQRELEHAPEKIVKLITNLKSEYTEFLNVDDEAVDLATEYIMEKVVGQTSYADCLHIALTTINRADLLVS